MNPSGEPVFYINDTPVCEEAFYEYELVRLEDKLAEFYAMIDVIRTHLKRIRPCTSPPAKCSAPAPAPSAGNSPA